MKAVISSIFTKEKISEFIINEALGRFIGFLVGMWTSSWFTKTVYEKKGINNLFGLVKRKKIIVNTTPEWLQFTLSVLIGFIALELVNYFFKHKVYLSIYNFLKGKLISNDRYTKINN